MRLLAVLQPAEQLFNAFAAASDQQDGATKPPEASAVLEKLSQDAKSAAATAKTAPGLLSGWCQEWFRGHVRAACAPAFWSRAAPPAGGDGSLSAAVEDLAERLRAVLPPLIALCASATGGTAAAAAAAEARLLRIARAELFHSPPARFAELAAADYAASLESHATLHELREEEPEVEAEARRVVVEGLAEDEAEVDEDDAERLADAVAALRRRSSFERMCSTVHELQLLDALVAPADVKRIVDAAIDRHIAAAYEGSFEERALEPLLGWLDQVVIGWLRAMVPASDSSRQAWLSGWRARLRPQLLGALAELRSRELFDIIIDFPDSLPAVEDLKECTVTATQRSKVVESLRFALRKRLLKPSTDTAQVINVYVLAIKALRALDSTGVMLDLVCAPVRAYLQRREDTIRCIITSLIDESNSELSDELAEGRPIELADSDGSDAEEAENWNGWIPDPVDANPATSRSRRTADVTSMLITIYGSKELFVTEYQALLADRLLALTDFDVNKEIKHLELLKLRFGEEQMHLCEVMLKDFKDSKRIGARIREKKAEKARQAAAAAATDNAEQDGENADPVAAAAVADAEDPYRVFVLSRLFWPEKALTPRGEGEDTLELPAAVRQAFEQYTEEFTVLKGMRTLEFKPQLGTVSLSLELESGTTLDLKVSPMHATIIMLFGDQKRWTLKELRAKMQVSTAVLEKRMLYWVHMGLIKPVMDEAEAAFELDEAGYEAAQAQGGAAAQDAPPVDDDASPSDDRIQQQQDDTWAFVQGMLTNNGPAGGPGLHQMLGFLCDGYEWTEAVLVRFLNTKVAEGLLTLASGEYNIVADADGT